MTNPISEATHIIIKGAKEHNLKSVNLTLPKYQLIVFTGLSGSGKTSMAFDTIYADGQRRYVESLSAYARQFLGIMKKPDCDSIKGLAPTVSIDQKRLTNNPRSTVGTITEIYDYLRLLYARVGRPHCPQCHRLIIPQTETEITAQLNIELKNKLKQLKQVRFFILSPIIKHKKGEFQKLFTHLKSEGYYHLRIDNHYLNLKKDDLTLIKTNYHDIDVIIDRFNLSSQTLNSSETRIKRAIHQALVMSDGLVIVGYVLDKSFQLETTPKKVKTHLYSEKYACPDCNISLPPLEPNHFSFNSPLGACPTCHGLGTQSLVNPSLVINPRLTLAEGGIKPLSHLLSYPSRTRKEYERLAARYGFSIHTPIGQLSSTHQHLLLYGDKKSFEGVIPNLSRRYRETDSNFMRREIGKYMVTSPCSSCQGYRLKPISLEVNLAKLNIIEASQLPISELITWLNELPQTARFTANEIQIANPILTELIKRTNFLDSIGLNYLSLDRQTGSLSGGESQRIRLASQIGSGLTGVLYILDEPSIGLHPKDNQMLVNSLKKLKNMGNTLIIVEHDPNIISNSDLVIDFGPNAGAAGGRIVFQGTPTELKSDKHLTGKYFGGKLSAVQPSSRHNTHPNLLTISGCHLHNLKNISVSFPLGRFICVTGVSGSGKSSLLVDTLYPALQNKLNPRYLSKTLHHNALIGTEMLTGVRLIDQKPIGRTPRSNPATYTGVFTPIRELFANTKLAKSFGYKPGTFSFNVKGGRCENCHGDGKIKIEMQFLPDIYIDCDVCHATRYNHDTLQITFRGLNIAETLELTIDEATQHFSGLSKIINKLNTLTEVGLGYLKLGQPAPSLSGGEAQRIKLATELAKTNQGANFYILDEPTTGLHYDDVSRLLKVLKKLVFQGHTVAVIEHNLDVIRSADHIIDLGPEGGRGGGEVVAVGTPTEIKRNPNSYTGKYL